MRLRDGMKKQQIRPSLPKKLKLISSAAPLPSSVQHLVHSAGTFQQGAAFCTQLRVEYRVGLRVKQTPVLRHSAFQFVRQTAPLPRLTEL